MPVPNRSTCSFFPRSGCTDHRTSAAYLEVFTAESFSFRSTAFDSSLLSNIQKLFSERIEIFTSVEFSKVSVLTGIIKIGLKVGLRISSAFCLEMDWRHQMV